MDDSSSQFLTTGVAGLDDVLAGGLPRKRCYLVQGDPGVGKTTLAIQFLREGARFGERCLYVTLSETREELNAVARSHGWTMDGVDIYDLSAGGAFAEDEENTLYVPAEVELGERMERLIAEVERVGPHRVVIDSCSERRLLSQSALRFRRQVVAMKEQLMRRVAQHGFFGRMSAPINVSYLADTVVLTRYFEARGRVRKAISVLKKRAGRHEDTIRELALGPKGFEVGPPLSRSHGVLTGVPMPEGDGAPACFEQRG